MEVQRMSTDNSGVTNHGCEQDQDQDKERNPRIRAVNLGGWLVIEGWIKPSLFDGIPNKDLLDGTQVQFKSAALGTYLCAESGGGSEIVSNRASAALWETFRLWRINQSLFNFRVNNKQFVGISPRGKEVDHLVAVSDSPGRNETFEIVRNPSDPTRLKIKASNGFFLQVSSGEVVTADYCEKTSECEWGDEDPSVFLLAITGRLGGEFQVTNGHGPDRAPQVMRDHWSTHIVEEDFKFVVEKGLNAVRIPVGWWIATDPNPPPPYVSGSLPYLDAAFSWAEKYGLKVIVDLHATPGSQNRWEHSSSRDGFHEWGQTDDTIQQTLDVIEFLTSRYTKSSSLYAIDLMNEPIGDMLPLETIFNYYKAGYDVVRKHSNAYVIMSRVMAASRPDPAVLLPLAAGRERIVIDLHHYNVHARLFNSPQGHIDLVYNKRATQLSSLITSDGPLIFVGEWTAEWNVSEATEEKHRKFVDALLEVYGKATFGWAFWTLKNVRNHWSLEWMIKNGYIKLT